MVVTLTPNVKAVVRADPVMQVVIEQLRKEPRPGYLHLFRSSPRSRFCALYVEPDGTRHETTALDLGNAILAVLE